jgi:hypothetical protein
MYAVVYRKPLRALKYVPSTHGVLVFRLVSSAVLHTHKTVVHITVLPIHAHKHIAAVLRLNYYWNLKKFKCCHLRESEPGVPNFPGSFLYTRQVNLEEVHSIFYAKKSYGHNSEKQGKSQENN